MVGHSEIISHLHFCEENTAANHDLAIFLDRLLSYLTSYQILESNFILHIFVRGKIVYIPSWNLPAQS